MYKLGIDIGSTTVKVALLSDENNLIFSDYQRHFANIRETLQELVGKALAQAGDKEVHPVITGSGGLTLAKHLEVPFVQEVIAVSTALTFYAPQTDVAIELGGEDAKIIYFENGSVEQRMNGICAGGTGSFIDQMASLVQTDATGLNEYAKNYNQLYPIAARCGVFAKTDIQPLINEGAKKEDLAASIFQAVVNQTISGLACGKPIRGHVAFLGGPLHFLSELKTAFIRTLKLDDEHTIVPDNSHLFAAIGSGLNFDEKYKTTLQGLHDKLSGEIHMEFEVARMDPLFANQGEFDEFIERHDLAQVVKGDLSTYEGNCYLGIDAGSTTTKAAVIGEDGKLLYSYYSSNNGSPLATAIGIIKDIKEKLPAGAKLTYSCSTGYGEALLKSAFQLDEGEVETIAHYYAAAFFNPDVDCILDIGGQDMKCIKIKNRSVDSVLLNEACSSGCGSFIETFAKSLGFAVADFAKEALFAEHPIDLGTRCTVFMNSKVKQAQKEGASVSDISAGLAYSVIKNAIYKVIKLSDPKQLGKNVVVQGGTFYNNAVLRSFEKITGINVIRPDIAGIMGAFGAALIAKERFHQDGEKSSTMLPMDDIINLEYTTKLARCGGCTNNCLLTINQFSGGRRFVSGNRCEKGLGKEKTNKDIPNLIEYKNQLLFDYEPLSKEEATRGTVGIPRVLNMYEHYPMWATIFKKLGFSVVLSPVTTRKVYEMGIESIPSESECYPAKLAHGHVKWLIDEGVDFVFYPCIPYERKETEDASNYYNCPIVGTYPENIKNNVDEITSGEVVFKNPFFNLISEKVFIVKVAEWFNKEFGVDLAEAKTAVKAGWDELIRVKTLIQKKGEETLKYLEDNKAHGIVLAGRPYHADPEINHGIPELITSYGLAVLTEDSISHLGELERPLIVLDQWMFHTRLYRAANYLKTRDDIDIIQLNSFGCGIDAVTTDAVADIVTGSGKIYTCLKIDEVNNLGAARIRIRSLLAAIRVRDREKKAREIKSSAYDRKLYTKQSKKNGMTILMPQIAPVHFNLIEAAFRAAGYNIVIPKTSSIDSINTGLRYVNNDACYPSTILVGQIMHAIESGEYDMDNVAVLMSQTGGVCRASNYISFYKRALANAGYPQVPVLSLNMSGLDPHPGFKFTPKLIQHGLYAIVLGDTFQRCLCATRPYEKVPGSADALYEKLNAEARELISRKSVVSHGKYKKLLRRIVKEFDELERIDVKKPRVGIVGEIMVKFSPVANNDMIRLLEAEGAEVRIPDFADFFEFSFYNGFFRTEQLGMKKKYKMSAKMGIKFFEFLRKAAKEAFDESKHFERPLDIATMAEYAKEVVELGNLGGEGWYLTAEMIEEVKHGDGNVVCVQPFGCLPNHVIGKGVIKRVRQLYPNSNIVAIDFDPGASEVNQLNRIKLMLSTAFKRVE